jgi:hypothetical protein
MNPFFQRLLLVVVACIFSACRKEVAETYMVITMTPGLTVDRFGRADELGPIREAVTLQEVSFMLRMHEADAEILAQVQRRGLAEPIDDKAAEALGRQGATAPLLAQLRVSPFLLTPPERALYASRAEKRTMASATARSEQDEVLARSRAQLDGQIRAAESRRMEDRSKADQARIRELEGKLSKERYSRNSLSPYQGIMRDLEQARERARESNGGAW